MFKFLLYCKYNLLHQHTAEQAVLCGCMAPSEQQGQLPAQDTALTIYPCVRRDGSPQPREHPKSKSASRTASASLKQNDLFCLVWDCCTLSCEEWLQKNALQLMAFPALPRRIVGELKLENLVNEFVFPAGFVLEKESTAFVQRSSTMVLKRRQRWKQQKADTV